MYIVSAPRYDLIHRFSLDEVGLVFRCSACNRPVFLLYKVEKVDKPVHLSDDYTQINTALEPFEMKYLTGAVSEDLHEALVCYANSCWNAFAAMCRRCIQSVCSALGADGKSKVQNQLKDLQDVGIVDEDTFKQLEAIMLTGHDGAHPHLPALSSARAAVLLQLMKDVLYQLFVRTAIIRESIELRTQAKMRQD